MKTAGEKTRNLIHFWGPVLLYALAIFWASSRSTVPHAPKHVDKIFHFAEYFCFAFLLGRALSQNQLSLVSRCIMVLFLASLYAALDEYYQAYVPGRFSSIFDWFADVAGILGMITLMISRVKWRGRVAEKKYETI